MKTKLIFFDSFENSIKGTIRGLIAFISLIIFDIVCFSIRKNSDKSNIPKNIYAMILVYLLLCSAIGVQLPSTYLEALIYGLLVGFVIYSILNFYNQAFNYDSIPKENINKSVNIIINILLGTISCGFAASITYLLLNY